MWVKPDCLRSNSLVLRTVLWAWNIQLDIIQLIKKDAADRERGTKLYKYLCKYMYVRHSN